MIIIPQHAAERFFNGPNIQGKPMSGVHAAKCPVCGDYKHRMYLLSDENGGFRVYCHNCAYGAPLLTFAKDFYPTDYQELLSESVNDFFTAKKKKKKIDDNKLKSIINQNYKRRSGPRETPPALIHIKENAFKLVEDCPDICMVSTIKECRQMLLDRLLPEKLIDTFYYAYQGEYKNRILIPFWNEYDEPYYFQAMATLDWQKKCKYTNFKHESIDERPIYNEHKVDTAKNVYIVEGLFDSTFLDNSVATLGVSMSRAKIKRLQKKFPERTWVFDNDEKGIAMTKKMLEMNERCFVFPKEFRKIKDINDIALKIGVNKTRQKVRKHCYNGIEGLLEMTRK